ncbi:MAG: cysteine desulfurase [Euryarchaeota archaeon]|nr:cysteine desulfurase [Euryarchaeota archaeon]
MYADYATSAPPAPEVKRVVLECLEEHYASPSSLHEPGLRARRVLEAARESVARLIGASSSEIVFTSSGTEANNLAVKGYALANRRRGRHIVTTAVEQYSVLHPLQSLAREGFRITRVGVDRHCRLKLEELENAIAEDTILISVQHVNHEVGTVQEIERVAEIADAAGVALHCDGTCAAGFVRAEVAELGVDLYTITAHRFYGPKGAGALYLAKGTRLLPLIEGGTQEQGYRAGAENLPAIAGMGKAAELALAEMEQRLEKLRRLRRLFLEELERHASFSLNGHPEHVNPVYINVSFPGVSGDALVSELTRLGVHASTGSPCMAQAAKTSHVLEAMGLEPELVRGAVLFSFGIFSTEEEVLRAAQAAAEAAGRLRGEREG